LIRPNQTGNPVLSNPTLSEWFNPGCFAQPAAMPTQPLFRLLRGAPGLTDFGRKLVRRCEELGVLVDVSH